MTWTRRHLILHIHCIFEVFDQVVSAVCTHASPEHDIRPEVLAWQTWLSVATVRLCTHHALNHGRNDNVTLIPTCTPKPATFTATVNGVSWPLRPHRVHRLETLSMPQHLSS